MQFDIEEVGMIKDTFTQQGFVYTSSKESKKIVGSAASDHLTQNNTLAAEGETHAMTNIVTPVMFGI